MTLPKVRAGLHAQKSRFWMSSETHKTSRNYDLSPNRTAKPSAGKIDIGKITK